MWKQQQGLTAICLLIMAAAALGFCLRFLSTILVPFCIAIFLMHLLQPVVNLLSRPPRRWCNKVCKRDGELCCEGIYSITRSRRYSDISDAPVGGSMSSEAAKQRRGHTQSAEYAAAVEGEEDDGDVQHSCMDYPIIPRWLAVIMAIVLALSLVVVLGVIVYGSVTDLEAQFYRYEVGASDIAKLLKKYLAVVDYSLDDDVVPWLVRTMRELTPLLLTGIMSCVAYSIYVLIFLCFLLISPSRPIPSSAWGAIDLHIRRYIRLKTTICLSVGVATGLILWALHVQMAWVFGLIAFVLNFLPNLGPMASTFLPTPLVILDPDLSAVQKVLAFALPTLVHLLVGNVIEPKIFGESFSLSPVVVLLNIAFWSLLWSWPGAILSVPLLVCARITCLHLEHPYARVAVALLEGRIFEANIEALGPVPQGSWDAQAAGREQSDSEMPA